MILEPILQFPGGKPVSMPAGVIVAVTPLSAGINQSGTQSFAASVAGVADQSVTWSVDGVAGGNATVGTIDANGHYTAPAGGGSHTITATSTSSPTAFGMASVAVVDNAPAQYAGFLMKDTANGHLYTLQVTNGVVTLVEVS